MQRLTALLCLQDLTIYLFWHQSQLPSLLAATQCLQLVGSCFYLADSTKSTVSQELILKQSDCLFLQAAYPALAFPCTYHCHLYGTDGSFTWMTIC